MQKNPKCIFLRCLGSCYYLQEEKLQMIKTFTTCVKKIENFLQFSPGRVSYPESEGWKPKQYFLSAFAFCQKGPLLAENIQGSSVEINVNELSLTSEITLKL